MLQGCRKPTLVKKLMTFTGVSTLWALPGRLCRRPVSPADCCCRTPWRSSASSTRCETSCSGWTVLTCRLMHTTAPGRTPIPCSNNESGAGTKNLNHECVSSVCSQGRILCRVGHWQSSRHQIRDRYQGRQFHCQYWYGKCPHQQKSLCSWWGNFNCLSGPSYNKHVITMVCFRTQACPFSMIHRSKRNLLSCRKGGTRSTRSGRTRWIICR